VVSESTQEFADTALKRDVLQDMAKITGGKYFEMNDVPAMPAAIKDGMKSAALTTTVPQDHPIWDMPLLLIIAVSLVGTEWLVRRRSGLS